MPATGLITASSTPIYCWFGGETCWTCYDFINWHKALAKQYSKQQANEIFIKSWVNDPPFISSAYDCRSFDGTFRAYAKANGFFDALYHGIGVIAKPIGVADDVLDSAGNVVKSLGKGAENTAKVLKWLVPAIAIIVAIGALVWLVKNSKGLIPA